MTYAKNTRVIVSQFVRRGDDADVTDLEGWVVFHGEAVIVIANTPDWAQLEPDDYWTATYALDDVIVSEAAPPRVDADYAERGSGQAMFLIRACALFLMALGLLGWSWFWFSIGLCVFAAPLIIRAAHAADARKGHKS